MRAKCGSEICSCINICSHFLFCGCNDTVHPYTTTISDRFSYVYAFIIQHCSLSCHSCFNSKHLRPTEELPAKLVIDHNTKIEIAETDTVSQSTSVIGKHGSEIMCGFCVQRHVGIA